MRTLWILAAIATALTASCNSSLDNTSGTTVTNASATGVWSGTDSVSGLPVSALINAAGEAVFIRGDGVQFFGTVQVSGNTLAVTVDGYIDFLGTPFPDGSTSGLGTVDGTVTSGATITATLTFTTTGNTAISGSWSLSFQTFSNDSSSTGAVSANYTDNVTGTVLAIASSGVMTSQNATTGCVLNGAISTNDSSHDLYEVSYTYGSCTSTYAVLNGVQFTGLATLDPTTSQLTMAVSAASTAGAKYAIESTLSGS